MKYRTRLYLYIGSLFVVVMLASYFIERWYTRKELIIGRNNAQQQIIANEEKRRQHTENYMKDVLEDVRAKIKTQIYELETYIPLQQSFIDKGAQWVSSATYVVTTTWVDMLQVGSNKEMDSLVLLKEGALDPAEVIFYESGLRLAHMGGKAYVAVPLSSRELVARNEDIATPSSNIDFFVLYDPTDLMEYKIDAGPFYVFSIQVDPLQPFFSWRPVRHEVERQSQFLKDLKEAQAILKANPYFASIESIQAPIHPSNQLSPEERMLSTYEQQGMLWALSTFTVNAPALIPQGIVRMEEGTSLGLLGKEVFYTRPQLEIDEQRANHFAVIPAPKLQTFFFGETVRLFNGQEVTLGVHGERVLKPLARATDQTTLFFSDGEQVAAYAPNGTRLRDKAWDQLTIQELGMGNAGFIQVGDIEYFYLHLKPLSNSDMHLYLFQPRTQAFSLILGIDQILRVVIREIGWLMRIVMGVSLVVVLVLLHFLAKRVTGRITLLAQATEHLAEGHYDEVKLPDVEVSGKDEIAKLYDGFKRMIQGLIEKERVRGVLDKVVSSEIAEEILKGEVALGGEERVVSVLFADIRGFTKTIENMDPADAIKMLNDCMTLLAKVIDAHGGVIDKFVGDEVMALFGAPIDKPESGPSAVACAQAMIKELDRWNREHNLDSESQLGIGIGVHRGAMIAGNMGSENRLNYTVIGANVNLAFRLCSAAEPMELLVTEEVLDETGVRESVTISGEKEIELKGFSNKIKVFSIRP